jgi:hypothetical protein
MMKTTNFPGRVEKRQAEAQERAKVWGALSPNEQLKVLDDRLGTGKGAKRQRARLAKLLTVEQPVEKPKRKAKKTS